MRMNRSAALYNLLVVSGERKREDGVPRSLRQLRSDLITARFEKQTERGKGNHAVWEHPDVGAASVTPSGKDGDDAKPYQEKEVREAIALVRQMPRRSE
jgi:hypothetical protein